MATYLSDSPRDTFNTQPNPCSFCVFCNTGNHVSHECTRYKSGKMFWQRVLLERRCKNCLRMFHRAEKCYNQSFCHLGCSRKDKHSAIICHTRYAQYNKFTSKPYSHSTKRNSTSYYSPRYRWYQEVKGNFFPVHNYGKPFSVPDHKAFSSVNQKSVYKSNVTSNNSCNVNSQSCQVGVCSLSKADASTQTTVDLFEETISSHSQKFSQGSQTENTTVTDSSQTDIYIPLWVDIPPPPPIEEILGVPEIDKQSGSETHVNAPHYEKVPVSVNVPHYENIPVTSPQFEKVPNVPHYENSGVKNKSRAESLSLPSFLRSAVDTLVTELNPKGKDHKPFRFTSFPHWN